MDRNNNVYLTGYYGDANYGPECWGILKLDSNTGDALYEVTITEDSSYYDDISIGLAACFIIGLYILNEFGYDKFHQNYYNIFRIVNDENQRSQVDYTIKEEILKEVIEDDIKDIQPKETQKPQILK